MVSEDCNDKSIFSIGMFLEDEPSACGRDNSRRIGGSDQISILSRRVALSGGALSNSYQ
jgi:hypothetical protein